MTDSSEVRFRAAGFFHLPPLWVGGGELPEDGLVEDMPEREEEACRFELKNGLRGLAYRDGLFLLDFSEWKFDTGGEGGLKELLPRLSRRTSVLNAFLACLYSAMRDVGGIITEKMTLNPKSVVQAPSLGSRDFSVSDGFVRSVISSDTRGASGWGDSRIIKRYWLPTVHHVPIHVVEAAADLFDRLVGDDPDWAVLAELCLQSAVALEQYEHTLALAAGWGACEWMLNAMWRAHVDELHEREGEVFIDKSRRDRLGRLRASEMSEFLSLLGFLPFDTYKSLTAARKARNDWLHGLKQPSKDDAKSAFDAAKALVQLVRGVGLNVEAIPMVGL